MNKAYIRLVNVNNKNKLNKNADRLRLSLSNGSCFIDKVDNGLFPLVYINCLNDVYDILGNNNYIENLSCLSNKSSILNNIILKRNMWHSIYTALRDLNNRYGVLNSFTIEKVKDLDDYATKSALLGSLIIRTNLFLLLCNKNLDIKLIIENDLHILNNTQFGFSTLKIRHIKLQHLNMENLNTLGYLFYNCTEVKCIYLDIQTENIKNFSYMFFNCTNLEELHIERMNTDNAVDFSYMFAYCTMIRELNLNHFNVSNVSYFNSMFESCEQLEKLYIDNWKISFTDSLDLCSMFKDCFDLRGLNLNVFANCLEKKFNVDFMFDGTIYENLLGN